jgi:WD40 repeat protein
VFVTGDAQGNNSADTVAYDAASGSTVWTAKEALRVVASIAVSPDGSRVFVTGNSYGTAAYDASNGTRLWFRMGGGSRASDLALSSDGSRVFVTGMGCAENAICGLVGGSNYFYEYVTLALDASTGVVVWTGSQPGPSNDAFGASVEVALDDSRVFVTGGHFMLTGLIAEYTTAAFSTTSGEKLWTSVYSGPEDRFDAAKALAVSPNGRTVFVTGASSSELTDTASSSHSDYATVAYDAATGAQLWVARYAGAVSSGGSAVAASPDGARVFVTGDAGTVAYEA